MDAIASRLNPTANRIAATKESIAARALRLLAEAKVADEKLQRIARELCESKTSAVAAVESCFGEHLITEADFQRIVAILLDTVVHTEVSPDRVAPDFVKQVPIAYARRFRIIGLKKTGGYMPIVTDVPGDPAVVDHIGLLLRTPARVELAPAAVVRKAIHNAYSDQESDFGDVLEHVEVAQVDYDVSLAEDGDLLETASRAPVIKLVNMLLFEAVKRLASDVHIQPLASHVQARFRIDGVLYDYLDIPSNVLDEVISRIKVIGKMDIAEKRLAQDGRTTVSVGDRSIDLRISVIPTSYGERAVLRLLDKSARLYALAELGMSDRDRRRFQELIQKTHGIILVTGPTGSGKSTTLYAALQYLDCKERNIITLEDPIEYQLPGISQTQVSTKKGMTFATGLRAVLRQDPDIIMVGEIRDGETARMAVQSSLTGHLVFSTLHTNNAAGAVSRLLDLGIEPYLVASSLLASVAQRLVRIVCSHCAVSVSLDSGSCRRLGLNRDHLSKQIRQARGCEACANTGYRGRRGIFETLIVDERIRELIIAKSKTSEIERRAIAGGMATLRQDALRKLLEGQTTIEEVLRVTHEDATAEAPLDKAEAIEAGMQ